MHRRGIYNSLILSSPRGRCLVLRMCQERVGGREGDGERARGTASAESEVNPLRRNITCTNECAHCLSLTLRALAGFFRGLEGFLLSEGSDGLMNVHCFTQPQTVVCAEDIGLFFGWAHRGYVFNNVL